MMHGSMITYDACMDTAKNTQMYFGIQMFTEFRSYILKKLF